VKILEVVVQKTTTTVNKTKQSLKNIKIWFSQCEVRQQVETITKKFTIKDGRHHSEEEITKESKSQYTQIPLSLKKNYSSKEKTKEE
jgi:hypothetical protein